MYQLLYCFGSGGNTSGGSASDFDDSYNQAMGYTDTLGGVGRSDDSGQARQTTAEERAAANYASEVQAAADARGGDLSDDSSFAEAQARAQAADFARQFGATPFPGADTPGGPISQPAPERVPGKAGTVTVAGAPFVSGGRSSELAYADALARSIGRTPELRERPEVGFFDNMGLDVTDPANIQGMQQYGIAAPTSVTQQAGVQQARSITDFDDVTLSQGPGVPKDVFEQDLTPRTKEEKEMAEDRGYFNYQDLNKDGTVTDFERTLAAQGLGIVGRLSDIGRRMSIGPTTEAGTAAIPGRDFDYARTATGAISPRDPNYMGPGTLDYEGQAYGTPDAGLTTGGDGGGAGQPAVVAPIAPVTCPDGYKYNAETNACEYVGAVAPGAVSQAAPITQTTQYTGIGGLEPFVLRPTYTAPTSFTPSYNVNVG